jgi:hypothetical protein
MARVLQDTALEHIHANNENSRFSMESSTPYIDASFSIGRPSEDNIDHDLQTLFVPILLSLVTHVNFQIKQYGESSPGHSLSNCNGNEQS